MWTHFNNVVTTQRQLADSFTELGQKSPELQEEFAYNAETQKALVRNGETLLGTLFSWLNISFWRSSHSHFVYYLKYSICVVLSLNMLD